MLEMIKQVPSPTSSPLHVSQHVITPPLQHVYPLRAPNAFDLAALR
jgi:hypothetical protein